MRGLGKTTAELARLRKAMAAAAKGGDDAGLASMELSASNPGALKMLAHVPSGLPKGAPLVVVLHGCTQRAGGYARDAGWVALAERLGFAVLAPEQDSANNPNRCFNWFEPGDIGRGAGEAASIHAMIAQMVAAHALDPQRVFVTGLSAGGAMTAVMLATYPETFAAGAVVAGLPYGAANNIQEAFAAMHGGARQDAGQLAALVKEAAPAASRHPRLAIWHGEADATVAAANAQALARQWAAVHGLPGTPDEVQARTGWIRSTWRGPGGEAIVEMNLLPGLGHGTPLAAGGEDPIGQVAPFLLEAGVSSSLEIARFWGLAPAESAEAAQAWTAVAEVSEEAAPTGGQRLGDSVMASITPHVPEDVRRLIAGALGSVGLLR